MVDNIAQDVVKISLSMVQSEVNMVGLNPREWWIDTRATRHVCSNRGMFTTFEPVLDGESLFMGNSTTSAIESRGNVILKMTSGKELTLKNVLYVPKIWKNFVSRSFLNKHSFHMVFESSTIVLTKNGLFIRKGYECGGMFKLSVMTIRP